MSTTSTQATDPNLAHLQTARTQIAKGDLKNAAQTLNKAQKQAPNDPRVFVLAGVMAEKSGNIPGAFDALQRAVTLAPDWGPGLLELARSMSYYASLKLGAPAPERRAAMARAKVQLGQSMRFVGQQAVQLHGGIGVTDEYIVSHYFKKLTQLEVAFGDTLHHLGEVSARMQDTAGVFA